MTLDEAVRMAEGVVLHFEHEKRIHASVAGKVMCMNYMAALDTLISATKNRGPEQGLPESAVGRKWKDALMDACPEDSDDERKLDTAALRFVALCVRHRFIIVAALNGQVDSPQETNGQ